MKATKATIRQRVEEVLQIRLAGAEFWNIRQYAAEKEWHVSDRQLWRYVAQTDQLLAEQLDKDRDKILNRHVAQRRTLYARAVQTGDYRAALAVLADEAKLWGLYAPQKLAPTTPDGETEWHASDDDRDAILTTALARLGLTLGPARGHGQTDPGGPPLAGPGPADGTGGVDPGPLAAATAPLPLAADVAPLFQTERQVHRGRGPGRADGRA
jgi:hypothetical protein